ncbi:MULTISPECIES: 4-vinyl reductase [Anaerolinea]|uniref:4-vinyl reductase n=1 Tax=Anaerolinea TaxID=233189 RepID=UPI0026017589|nr:4-vinyl reductase [Anaerolinea thermophila]
METILSSEIHQILVESMHEVSGIEPQEAFLSGNKKFLQALERVLYDRFGSLTGKGMAIRMGRSGFQTGLRRWGETLGLYSLEYRLLPFNRRVKVGLEQIARFLEEQAPLRMSICEEDNFWVIEVTQKPACAEHSNTITCYLLTGMFQEFMQWVGSGRFFPVRETLCRTKGAPCCRFEISRKPLE